MVSPIDIRPERVYIHPSMVMMVMMVMMVLMVMMVMMVNQDFTVYHDSVYHDSVGLFLHCPTKKFGDKANTNYLFYNKCGIKYMEKLQ